MKAYGSTNAVAFRRKVRKERSKAGCAGVLYLLGALALAVLAFFPVLNIGGNELWVATFFSPIIEAIGGTLDWIGIIVSALYLWILLAAVINFFKALSKISWLTKKSLKYVNGYNRNISAMEDMGKRFSGSFATIINLSFLIAVLQPNTSDVTITIYAYIMLAVGLVIHFLAGLIAGKVSLFESQGNGGNVEEVKRECGIFVYFFRNVMQLLAVAGMLFFFVPKCTVGVTLQGLLSGANLFEGDIVTTLVPVVLQALIVPCMFVLIKHATAATEFNRDGIKGKGMKNYRVFAFFVFLLASGVFAVDCLLIQPDPLVYDFVFVAAIAFIIFLVDCIFKTRVKEEEEEDVDPLDEMKKEPMMPPMPFCNRQKCMQQGMPMQMCGQPNMGYPKMPMNQPVYQQQPVYIPIYYPYPMQQPAPAPAPAPVEVKITSMPAPEKVSEKAPENIKPEPSPVEKAKQEEQDNQNAMPVEVYEAFDPKREWKVRCPRCGKQLIVRETSPYHRCPLCDKVFSLRKFKTYLKKD